MFLADPPPTAWDLNFRIAGIPVRVHPWFWLVALLLIGGLLQRVTSVPGLLGLVLPWMAALFVAVLTHELGHALVMRAYGRAPRITLYGLGGFTTSGYERLYSSRGFSTLGQVLIAAAGPAAGFLLAAIVGLVCMASGHVVNLQLGGVYGIFLGVSPFLPIWLWWFVESLLVVCVFWGVMNLLPIYPLDGGHIAREILVARDRHEGIRQSLVLSMVTAAGVAAIAALRWQDLFVALFFGYLAFQSYRTWQACDPGR